MLSRYNVSSFLLFALLLSQLTSCKPDPKTSSLEQIKTLEKKLFDEKNGVIDQVEAANIIALYTNFSETWPEDAQSQEFLFKAADVSLNVFHTQETISLLNKYIQLYPKSEKAPQALFLKAFAYENYFSDIDNARASYEQFLKQYPTHELAQDAQISLDNLGKSPEDIIKSFQQN